MKNIFSKHCFLTEANDIREKNIDIYDYVNKNANSDEAWHDPKTES